MQLLIGMSGARKRTPDRPLLRSRSRASVGARIGYLTPRTCDGNFDRTTDLIRSVDAAEPQLFADVLRESLRASVRSLSRSRANFGVRKSFLTRRSRVEEIELDEGSSPPLDSASWQLSNDGACAILRFTEPICGPGHDHHQTVGTLPRLRLRRHDPSRTFDGLRRQPHDNWYLELLFDELYAYKSRLPC